MRGPPPQPERVTRNRIASHTRCMPNSSNASLGLGISTPVLLAARLTYSGLNHFRMPGCYAAAHADVMTRHPPRKGKPCHEGIHSGRAGTNIDRTKVRTISQASAVPRTRESAAAPGHQGRPRLPTVPGRYGRIEWFDGRERAVTLTATTLREDLGDPRRSAAPDRRPGDAGDLPTRGARTGGRGHPSPAATPGGVRGPPPEGCVTPLQSDFPAAGARLVPGAASLVGSGRPCLPGAGRDAKFRRLPRGPATRDRGRQRAGIRETSAMHCPRCQHENRPQAKFCEECTGPLKEASPTTRSNTDPKSEVESLRQALTEALERETASADLLRVISASPTQLGSVVRSDPRRALRLCGATTGGIARYEGGLVSAAAVKGPLPPRRSAPRIRGD